MKSLLVLVTTEKSASLFQHIVKTQFKQKPLYIKADNEIFITYDKYCSSEKVGNKYEKLDTFWRCSVIIIGRLSVRNKLSAGSFINATETN